MKELQKAEAESGNQELGLKLVRDEILLEPHPWEQLLGGLHDLAFSWIRSAGIAVGVFLVGLTLERTQDISWISFFFPLLWTFQIWIGRLTRIRWRDVSTLSFCGRVLFTWGSLCGFGFFLLVGRALFPSPSFLPLFGVAGFFLAYGYESSFGTEMLKSGHLPDPIHTLRKAWFLPVPGWIRPQYRLLRFGAWLFGYLLMLVPSIFLYFGVLLIASQLVTVWHPFSPSSALACSYFLGALVVDTGVEEYLVWGQMGSFLPDTLDAKREDAKGSLRE